MAAGSIGGFLPLSGGKMGAPIISSAGTASLPGFAVGESNTGFYLRSSAVIAVTLNGVSRAEIITTAIRVRSDYVVSWSSSTNPSGFADVGISRTAAGILAVGNGSAESTAGTLQATIRVNNAYVAGAVVPTGTITIQDNTGTTYRVPCLV